MQGKTTYSTDTVRTIPAIKKRVYTYPCSSIVLLLQAILVVAQVIPYPCTLWCSKTDTVLVIVSSSNGEYDLVKQQYNQHR